MCGPLGDPAAVARLSIVPILVVPRVIPKTQIVGCGRNEVVKLVRSRAENKNLDGSVPGTSTGVFLAGSVTI